MSLLVNPLHSYSGEPHATVSVRSGIKPFKEKPHVLDSDVAPPPVHGYRPPDWARLVHWLNQREADGPAFEVVAAALAITDGLRL